MASSWGRDVPHPSVVRIVAPGRDSISYGSGALVAVNQQYGLVVTNWHVVCEAAGPIVVIFPDGFRSGAKLLKTDRDWDLAALSIWRPKVPPIALANNAPQPGEPLTIAGYGSGSYRAVTGRCTQYVAPGNNQPFEMVELSAGARQGDSGGPILNSRGELAGVLFGTAMGRTSGSYGGRVRWFLSPFAGDFPQIDPNSRMIAQPASVNSSPESEPSVSVPIAAIGANAATPAPQPQASPPTDWAPASPSMNPRETIAVSSSPGPAVPASSASPSRIDQIKNILAAVGLVALLFHSLRIVSILHK
jgi:S1-C subfamily serine protease